MILCCLLFQVPRNKSKKGGMQKRVYFWAVISYLGKSQGVAWCASDQKVVYRHTKNLCLGTLFEDDGEVFRVVQTRAASGRSRVSYVRHFDFPDSNPPEDPRHWMESYYKEVKK